MKGYWVPSTQGHERCERTGMTNRVLTGLTVSDSPVDDDLIDLPGCSTLRRDQRHTGMEQSGDSVYVNAHKPRQSNAMWSNYGTRKGQLRTC